MPSIMRKLFLLLLIPLTVFSQEEIQVSEDYTTILIFPSEIDLSILGNEQEYLIKPSSNNSPISKFMLSLTYIKVDNVEKNTNLTVFTKDGNSYSFALKYAKVPKKLDPYYIDLKEGANTVSQESLDSDNSGLTTVKVKDSYYTQGVVTAQNEASVTDPSPVNDALYITNKNAYMEGYCQKHNNTPKRIFKTYDKSSNVKLTLKDISFDKDELYFHFSLSNNGGQAYDVDFINAKLSRDYKGVSTDQSIPMTPLFVFNKPARVNGNSELDFTMVFKKFTINDKKEFQIDLAEKEGERDLLVHINSKLINNPVKL